MTITSIIKANEGSFIESIDGYIRAGYQSTKIKNDASYADMSIGGKLHIETASLQHINAGFGFYTTNALFGKNEANGIPFFDADNSSYTLMGEAYLKGEWDQTMLKIGRQEIDTPFADTDDIGMIPNTFEAAVLINKDIRDTTLFFAYLDKMAGVDAELTSSFTKINNSNGVQIAGLTYEGIDNLTLSGWLYRLNNFEINQIVYAEAIYENTVGSFSYLLGIQYARQSYDTQTDAIVYGLQGEFTHETSGLSLGIAFGKSKGNTAFNGFGGGPFFTNSEHLTLVEAGPDGKAILSYINFDANSIGLHDLSFRADNLMLEHQMGSKANEFDFTVHYAYNDQLNFDCIYSSINDPINQANFKNIRIYANYIF